MTVNNNLHTQYTTSSPVTNQVLATEHRKQIRFEKYATEFGLPINQVQEVYKAICDAYKFSPAIDVWKATEEALQAIVTPVTEMEGVKKYV